MSKLSATIIQDAVHRILSHAHGLEYMNAKGETVTGKQRRFLETIELQVSLKNYDPSKDRRFSGVVVLPHPVKQRKYCVLGNAAACAHAAASGVDSLTTDKLKAFNKNKKLIKRMHCLYDDLFATGDIIRLIPRLLGPSLGRAGKFPFLLAASDSLVDRIDEKNRSVKFQMKKQTCVYVAVANVGMAEDAVRANLITSINFLVSLLKRKWLNVGSITVKSTMGPPQCVFM